MTQQQMRPMPSGFPPARWRDAGSWVEQGQAAIMVVGVPPDGATARLLDRALLDAGLAPEMLQLMQAVPQMQPPARLVVALGAAAASALLLRPVTLAFERGRILAMPQGGRLLLTEHPSSILRLADIVARGREYRRLVNDLLHAVPFQRRAA